MNMLNFLRGKIAKIEVQSPSKKCKNITPSQQIYLDQINNYIEIGGGYDILKQKLFNDINTNYMHESPLVQEIVILLRKGLETQEKEKERRCIRVVEELIQNCGRVMNQAFHSETFCEVLANNAVYLRRLKSSDRDQIRERLCGIFLYWHLKFKAEPRYIFEKHYEKLKANNAEFPTVPYIKQSQPKKNKEEVPKQDIENVDRIIEDCEKTVAQADRMLEFQRERIDTNFVRILKAKNKKLYALSTTGAMFSMKQKQSLARLYKKIRGQLKEIDKINETTIKEQAMEKQKQFLQEKMENISPKKSEKQIPKISLQLSSSKSKQNSGTSINNSNQKKVEQIGDFDEGPSALITLPIKASSSKQPTNIIDLDDDDPIDIPSLNQAIKKSKSGKQVLTCDQDLLDIDIAKPLATTIQGTTHANNYQVPVMHSTPKNKTATQAYRESDSESSASIVRIRKDQFKEDHEDLLEVGPVLTPKGSKNQYKELLDYEAGNFQSPLPQKRINFKQIYSANQLSPELKDLDLMNFDKTKSHQNMKSQEHFKSKTSLKSEENLKSQQSLKSQEHLPNLPNLQSPGNQNPMNPQSQGHLQSPGHLQSEEYLRSPQSQGKMKSKELLESQQKVKKQQKIKSNVSLKSHQSDNEDKQFTDFV